jgi:hypothetical protein
VYHSDRENGGDNFESKVLRYKQQQPETSGWHPGIPRACTRRRRAARPCGGGLLLDFKWRIFLPVSSSQCDRSIVLLYSTRVPKQSSTYGPLGHDMSDRAPMLNTVRKVHCNCNHSSCRGFSLLRVRKSGKLRFDPASKFRHTTSFVSQPVK